MKRNFKKLLTSLAAALLLFPVGALSASAAPEDEGKTEVHPSVHITKILKNASTESIVLPKLTFNFKVEPQGIEKNGVIETTTAIPVINDQSVTFTDADNQTATPVNGVSTIHKQTPNLLDDVEFGTEPAVYVYKITETQSAAVDPALGERESIIYSTKTYTLKVYVGRDGVVDGGTVTDEETGEKVDPGPVDPGEGGVIIDANGFNFENIYIKEAGSTDPEPGAENAGFIVAKTTKGNLAKPDDKFEFSLTLGKNELTVKESYELVLSGGATKSVKPGETVTFELMNGEKAYLNNVPAGVEVTVTETAFKEYTQEVTPVFNGVEQAKGTAEATGFLGEKKNKADYLNTWDKTTPTGIFLNNLPYIALIAAAAGGFALMIVSKRRRRA